MSNTYTHNNCHTQTNKTWIKHIHKQTKHGSKTYTHNNCHTQTSKKAVSQYNKRNQVPSVLSSKDRLIKEPKDFTCCEEVELRIFSILWISFNVLILDVYRKSSRKAVVLNLSLIVQYKKIYNNTVKHLVCYQL